MSKKMGPLLTIIQRIFVEITPILLVIFIVVIAFAQCCTVIFAEQSPVFNTLGGSIFALTKQVLGDIGDDSGLFQD